MIAAQALSIVTNGLHRKPLDTVYQALNLPETSCFPLITVILGYQREEPTYQKGRLSPKHIVHYGRYCPPIEEQLSDIVAEYDDHDRHLGLIDNWEMQGFQQRLTQSGFWWPMP